jgi:hypothetical protein
MLIKSLKKTDKIDSRTDRGPMLWFLKYFRQKIQKLLRSGLKTILKYAKNCIIGFREKRKLFAVK